MDADFGWLHQSLLNVVKDHTLFFREFDVYFICHDINCGAARA